MKKINWCFSVKGGLKVVEPSEVVASSYLDEAERTLAGIKDLIEKGDFIWASVRIYYCAYYSIYAFLQRIGVKSENHDFSIELVKNLLGDDLNVIEDFKKNRISSQYYLRVGQKNVLLENYSEVKKFYLRFKNLVGGIGTGDVKNYRDKLEELRNEKDN